jgi:predicted Rossmann fold nucleotide-binding protein DprA/Smf involved in DNA uptake
MRITITGTRDVPEAAGRCEALFERYLAPYATGGHSFFVGGAVGIDTLALDWLIPRRAPVTVVVPATVEDQPPPARDRIRHAQQAGLAEVVELRHPDFPEAEAYHARNRYMVDRSAFVIGYPLASTKVGGTWYTIEYAASKDMPRLIVPVPSRTAS